MLLDVFPFEGKYCRYYVLIVDLIDVRFYTNKQRATQNRLKKVVSSLKTHLC